MSSNQPPSRKGKKKKRGKRKKTAPWAQAGPLDRKTIPLSLQYNTKTGRMAVRGSGAYVPVRGHGSYLTDEFLPDLGHSFLGETGRVLGKGAGHLLKAMGLGEYDMVETNSLLSEPGKVTMSQDIPKICNDPKTEGFVMSHSEYIGELYSGTGTPTAFTVSREHLNPSNPALFPWLSTLANQFNEYEFKGLIFTLKTEAADVSTALSLGTMFGCVQYNVSDPPFQDKAEILNYVFAQSKKVSDSVYILVECKRTENMLNHLQIRPNNELPDGDDQKFYDLGLLNIGSMGCPSASVPIAEVWVSYDVVLYKPKLTTGGELSVDLEGGLWRSNIVTNAAPLLGMSDGANPNNLFSGTVSSNTITFPPDEDQGHFLVILQISGAAATVSAPSVSYTNCDALAIWDGYITSEYYLPLNGINSIRWGILLCVEVTDKGASLTFGTGGVLPTSGPGATLLISKINGGLVVPVMKQIAGRNPHGPRKGGVTAF